MQSLQDVMRTDDIIDDSNVRYNRNMDQFERVANFLNQFQSHFLQPCTQHDDNGKVTVATNSSSTVVGDITTKDLEDAVAFRSLVKQLKTLEGEKVVANEYGRNELQLRPLAQKLAEFKDEEIEIVKRKVRMKM